ncbi:MAG TPA: DNA polymerase III subunit gamma/tau [Chitinophagaceae bacterium]|jgi:DNA polymerase-3 subunit gamma/tau|nr:MAG: DNA polymerase III subunit tau [Bacteroidetes bacterium ADurb.BinA245]HNF46839.1 DNA polymerase III subunit gamma/tau [Chitinophagaceae bacterium]HNK61947.1 DNA polymerase III subunit gamma/tau [Chitinophagaceae bacterium]HNL60715.1 DNA polymerase III subunit gamma/tau [Chitinophagaceae bacterium]HNO54742.1 DNA polymerase III subunit gamma/tau [Chitinophagaceae bacterium]
MQEAKFIVSARKYRPQTFDTVVGQGHITTTLKNAIRHRQLGHAFLFCGPRGVGKTTCARILAKTINCENQTKEGEACDTCPSCKSFNDGASMNYFELDAASNNSVDNIRDLVDQVRFVPQSGRYKVYVIDEVHMLSQAAFNAFLKTLEEPPAYAKFILATTEKHKILPTILSRCQIFDFKRITTNDTVKHLEEICEKEAIKAERTALQVIAQKSEGCMRDALSILDKIVSFTAGELDYANTLEHLNILDAEFYFKLLQCMQEQDLSGAMLLYDEINRKGFEGDVVLNGFAEFIRNLLVCKDEKAAGLLEVVESFKDKYVSTAKNVSAPLLVSALNILNETEINYKAARNKRLHVELAIIKLCYLQQAIEISSGGSGLSKKKRIDGPVAYKTKSITPFAPEVKTSPGAKLIIETSSAELSIAKEATPGYEKPTAAVTEKITPVQQAPAKSTRITALDKIRQQYLSDSAELMEANEPPLAQESLMQVWGEYTNLIKNEKNPASHSFEVAVLRIIDGDSFEIVVADFIEKQFIEKERNRLFEFLQNKLDRKNIKFALVVEEKERIIHPDEIVLSSKEQFQKMIETYPMVLELKNRLKLDLDY